MFMTGTQGSGGKRMIRAVVFDLDGVLIDSEPYYDARRRDYFASFGVELSKEQMERFVGKRFVVAMSEVRASLPRELYNAIIDQFVPWEIDFTLYIRPETAAILRRIKEMGLKTAIASNSTPDKIALFLSRCGLEQWIDVAISGAEVGRGKPEPDIYLAAAQKLGVPAGVCAAVEDSDYGLCAAISAGCRVVCLVDRRFHFKQTQAHTWIQQLGELPDAIARLNER
jgi:HAD superfamily hydrolase (TIGR01509 family)